MDTTSAKISPLQESSMNSYSPPAVMAAPLTSLFSIIFRKLSFPTRKGSVFSHGDLRTANVMVKENTRDRYTGIGIIDWELSGFYPENYECTALTRTLNVVDENDWYLFFQENISPLQFSVRWMVARLWTIHPRTT